MKYLNEFRDRESCLKMRDRIAGILTRSWRLMEVCGGQTHSIVKFGLDELLPKGISLIHGPGCPVCVTPIAKIDLAIEIACQKDVILCSFGDMLRVPGSTIDLFSARARGADVHVVYSPMEAVRLAQQHPQKQIVFFAVGFETTAPMTAAAVLKAEQLSLTNFSVILSHVRVPPAIETILNDAKCQIDGFLAAGHVCTIMGYYEYEPIVARYKIPIVVTGFEPLDILEGVYRCIVQLEARAQPHVENQYCRSVTPSGNQKAQETLKKIFEYHDMNWRGFDAIPDSAFTFKPEYDFYNAAHRFDLEITSSEDLSCQADLILKGLKKPNECPHFGTSCNPQAPKGAPMVSSEGACAAYFNYRTAKSYLNGSEQRTNI